MKVTVNLYATFRLIAGMKQIALELPEGATVDQAVREVVKRAPVLYAHWYNADGDLYPHVHVFLNGSDVSTLPQGFDTPLQAEAELDFFPPVAGG